MLRINGNLAVGDQIPSLGIMFPKFIHAWFSRGPFVTEERIIPGIQPICELRSHGIDFQLRILLLRTLAGEFLGERRFPSLGCITRNRNTGSYRSRYPAGGPDGLLTVTAPFPPSSRRCRRPGVSTRHSPGRGRTG